MATAWSVPCAWPAATVVLLATGPSLSADQVARVRAAKDRDPAGVRVIAINDAHVAAPFADLLYACDQSWWHHAAKRQQALAFAGLKVTLQDGVTYPEVLQVAESGTEGFDPDPARLRTGRHSGYQALHLAGHLIGLSGRVLLLGYDMQRAAGGKSHFFGDHPAELQKASPFDLFIAAYETIRLPLRARHIEVINCTPGSAVTTFPAARLEDVL